MQVVKLPVGEPAPEDSDCIGLYPLPDGRCRLEASALVDCDDGGAAESIALIDGGSYDTIEQAEAAGLAWAQDQCVARVYVSIDARR